MDRMLISLRSLIYNLSKLAKAVNRSILDGESITQTTPIGMKDRGLAQGQARPGSKAGQSNEFTLICALKPGDSERMRKLIPDGFTGQRQENTDRIAQ
jgi:hypothetical protein